MCVLLHHLAAFFIPRKYVCLVFCLVARSTTFHHWHAVLEWKDGRNISGWKWSSSQACTYYTILERNAWLPSNPWALANSSFIILQC